MANKKDYAVKAAKTEPCEPGSADVGCSLHGWAVCSYCDWRSPNRRRDKTPVTKCAVCSKTSQGFMLCQACTNLDRQADTLFFEDGEPNLTPFEND